MSTDPARASSKATRIDRALAKSARTIAKRLRDHPEEVRARFLGDLFAELRVGGARAPRAADASAAQLVDPADRRAVGRVILGMWREMLAHDALTPERAAVLARRVADLVDAPAVLFVLAAEARDRTLDEAARLLTQSLARRHAAFLARAATLRIDRPLLESLGLALEGAQVRFHNDGHLASLVCGKRALTLDAEPGRGRYREQGKRGGSGFAIDERYERGRARGTFFSPWHDGEEYANEQPWLAWVSACAATVLSC